MREHLEQMRLAVRELPDLSREERTQLRGRILDFLEGTLIPHAEAEERGLYPAVAELLGNERATAPMIFDHRAICERVDEVAGASIEDVALLQELLYGLYGLIDVHLRKEEELYLPLVEMLWGVHPSTRTDRVLEHEP
jgi:iron-sulfur cluster repair protein YtfE (RIC family)